MATRACPSNRRASETREWRTLRPEGDPAPPEVLSVTLSEGEEVRWIWTHTAGSESIVTGYVVVEKDDDGGDAEAWPGAGEVRRATSGDPLLGGGL